VPSSLNQATQPGTSEQEQTKYTNSYAENTESTQKITTDTNFKKLQ